MSFKLIFPSIKLDTWKLPVFGKTTHKKFLSWRNISTPCTQCQGAGRYTYPNLSSWRRSGISGRAVVNDVCDVCWGTGDLDYKGINLREWTDHTIAQHKRVEELEELNYKLQDALSAEAREYLDLKTQVIALLGSMDQLDCGDSSCRYAKDRGGMRTNGGCNCIHGRMPFRREIQRFWYSLKHFLSNAPAQESIPEKEKIA